MSYVRIISDFKTFLYLVHFFVWYILPLVYFICGTFCLGTFCLDTTNIHVDRCERLCVLAHFNIHVKACYFNTYVTTYVLTYMLNTFCCEPGEQKIFVVPSLGGGATVEKFWYENF